MMVVSCEDWR